MQNYLTIFPKNEKKVFVDCWKLFSYPSEALNGHLPTFSNFEKQIVELATENQSLSVRCWLPGLPPPPPANDVLLFIVVQLPIGSAPLMTKQTAR